MLHPCTRLTWLNDAVGYGVIATERIPRGTILWALDPLDRVFSPADLAKMDARLWPVLETYSYINGSGLRVLCWDHGRFMNHSCDPVSLSPGVDFELAVRDIEPGDEITCDYTSLNLEHDLECLCGVPSCRGLIRSEEFADRAPVWDGQLQAAVAFSSRVPQPLAGWVDMDAVDAWALAPKTLPSAMGHHFPVGDAVTEYGRAAHA